jgi:hypothetical protein
VYGHYVYMADFASGLRVIDVSDPTHPQEVGFCTTPDFAYAVTVAGNLAYVADLNSGLRVINISDPTHPQEVGFCATPRQAVAVAVWGNYAYVAAEDSGLRVINIADSAHPQETGHYITPTWACGVIAAGNYAYVVHHYATVYMSDAAQGRWVGRHATSGWPNGAVAAGNYPHGDQNSSGLSVINVSDPANPHEAGYYGTSSSAMGVTLSFAVDGVSAFVADNEAGLQIVDFLGEGIEESFKPQASSPKPDASIIRGTLLIGRELSAVSRGPLALLDISGRKVLDLTPGPNDVSRLAPGVYFVRDGSQASTSPPQAVRKIVIQR